LKNVLWVQNTLGNIIKGVIDDIDNDKIKEIIIGIQGEDEEDAGRIQVFDYKGSLLWVFNPPTTFNYSGGKSDKLVVDNFEINDLFNLGKKQIVALYRDSHGWYQSCICVIENNGFLLSTYWHPGHLGNIKIGSSKNNEHKKILVTGLNNDLSPAHQNSGYLCGVFLLDPKNIYGEAPPYYGRNRKGSQEWYGIILPKPVGIHRLDIVDYNEDGNNEICLWTSSGHIFYLDFNGRIIGRGISDGAKGETTFKLIG